MTQQVRDRLTQIVTRVENPVGTHEEFTGEAIVSTIGDYSPEAAQSILSLSEDRRMSLYEDMRRTTMSCAAVYDETEDTMLADGTLGAHQNYGEYLKGKIDAYFDQ